MKKFKLGTLVLYILLAVGGLIMIVPFIWMLISSMKTWAECGSMPPTWWPKDPTLENYVYMETRWLEKMWTAFQQLPTMQEIVFME